MIQSNEAALLKAWPVLAPAGAHSGYASFDKDLSCGGRMPQDS